MVHRIVQSDGTVILGGAIPEGGEAGPQGPQGIQGPIGPTGPQGSVGPTGPVGPAGPQGPDGPAGPQGIPGTDGLDGADGPAGPPRVPNPGFEEFTGWGPTDNILSPNASSMETSVADWGYNTAFGAFAIGTASQSSVRAHIGTKSLLSTWAAGALPGWILTPLSGLTPGATYTATAWVYVPAGSPDVKLSDVFNFNGAGTSVKDAWVQISLTWTATQSTLNLGITSNSPGAGQCWIDEVIVTSSDATADYWTVDLSSPNNYAMSCSDEHLQQLRSGHLKVNSAPVEKLTANQAGVESSVADYFTNNNFGFATPATSIAQSAVRAHSGTKSMLVTWAAQGGGSVSGEFVGTNATGLIKGRQYTLSMWVWVPTGSPNVAASAMNLLFGVGSFTAVKDAWVQISVNFRAEGPTQNVAVWTSPGVGAGAGTQVYVDDISVKEIQPGPTFKSRPIQTQGGVPVTVKVWAKATGTNPRLGVQILSNDDSNQPEYAASGMIRTETIITPTGSWVEYTATHTPAAKDTRVSIEIRGYSNSGGTCDIYVDKVQLQGGEIATSINWLDLGIPSNFAIPVAPANANVPFTVKNGGVGITHSGNTMVVTVPGVYVVTCDVGLTNGAATYCVVTMRHRRGGANLSYRESVPSPANNLWDSGSVSAIFDAQVGDVFDVAVSSGGAGVVAEAAQRTHFVAHRISGPGPKGDPGPVGPAAAALSTDVTWQPLPYLNGWKHYNDATDPTWAGEFCRRSGIVFLRGIVVPTVSWTSTIAQLPVGFRPGNNKTHRVRVGVLSATAGANWQMDIPSDGTMQGNFASTYGGNAVSGLTIDTSFPAEN